MFKISDVKWIKITTDMFDDEKIDFIASLPESDAILIIWIRLLTLAGKCNAGGYIYLTEKIPYTEDMLAHKFKKPPNIVKLALDTFRKLDMLDMDENGIFLPNWEKHQNIEGLEKIRQQTSLRVSRYRDKQKQLPSCNVTSNATVTLGNAIDIDKDIDKELDKEKETIPYVEIVGYLNLKAGTAYRPSNKKTRELIHARWSDKFTLENFKTVIDKKCTTWLSDPKMVKYLRPETLFGTKFESYVNEKIITGGQAYGPNRTDGIPQTETKASTRYPVSNFLDDV